MRNYYLRRVALFLLLNCCFSFPLTAGTETNYIEILKPEISINEALDIANKELYDKLKLQPYFWYTVKGVEVDANKEIWDEYALFSTKDSHGKYKFVEELADFTAIPKSQYEYIGKNKAEDSVTNPYYPPDSKPQSEIMGRWKWESDVEKKGYVSVNSFNYKTALDPSQKEELFNQIIQALEYKFGPVFNEDAARAEGVDTWLSRAGVLIPPTTVSRGMIRFWHISGGVLWYTNAIINPLYYFRPEFSIFYEGVDYTDGNLVIAQEVEVSLCNETDMGDEDIATRVSWFIEGQSVPFHETRREMTKAEVLAQRIPLTVGKDTTIRLEVVIKGNPNVREVTHFLKVKRNTPVPMTASMPNGEVILGSYKLGQEIYDVSQGIPTGESLYGRVRSGAYIAAYASSNRYGGRDVVIDFVGTYEDGTPVKESRRVYRSYTYRQLDYYYVYRIKEARIDNYALPNSQVTLVPDASYKVSGSYQLGSYSSPNDETIRLNRVPLDYDFDARARVEADYYSTSDAWINLNGKTYSVGSSIPSPETTSLYLEGILIPETLANKKSSVSSASVLYVPVISYQRPASLGTSITRHLQGNHVTVHTPVVSYPTIETKLDRVQLLRPNTSIPQLVLEETFDVHYPTSGQHKNIPGYGNRDYLRTTKSRQVLFQFDVYKGRGYDGTYYPAGTWIDIGTDTTFFLPAWVKESSQISVGFRSLPINSQTSTDAYSVGYNGEVSTYKAIQEVKVEISGKISDFKVSYISDPNWQEHFRSNDTYFVSSQLPVLPSKNKILSYQQCAVKLGYEFFYDFVTNGDYTGSDDLVVVTPTYYHVDENFENRQPVDVYLETKEGFLAFGSDQDPTTNGMILDQTLRGITLEELKHSAKVLFGQYRSNGYSESDYLRIYQSRQPGNILRGKQIVLTEKQKIYTKAPYNQGEVGWQVLNESKQKWYGEHYIPNNAYFVKKGTKLEAFDRLSTSNEPFLQKGYIIVHLTIEGYHDVYRLDDLESLQASLAYKSPYSSEWLWEGYKVQQEGITFYEGDVVAYHLDKRASDNYGN